MADYGELLEMLGVAGWGGWRPGKSTWYSMAVLAGEPAELPAVISAHKGDTLLAWAVASKCAPAVEWLREKGDVPGVAWKAATQVAVEHDAAEGTPARLTVLREHGKLRVRAKTWETAAQHGATEVIDWLEASEGLGEQTRYKMLRAAAAAGQVGVLQAQWEKAPLDEWAARAVLKAAAKGQAGVIDWALAKGVAKVAVVEGRPMLLLQKGATVNYADGMKVAREMLGVAVREGAAEVLERLGPLARAPEMAEAAREAAAAARGEAVALERRAMMAEEWMRG